MIIVAGMLIHLQLVRASFCGELNVTWVGGAGALYIRNPADRNAAERYT